MNIINRLPAKVQERIEGFKHHIKNAPEEYSRVFNLVHNYLDALMDIEIISYDEEGYIMEYIGLIN